MKSIQFYRIKDGNLAGTLVFILLIASFTALTSCGGTANEMAGEDSWREGGGYSQSYTYVEVIYSGNVTDIQDWGFKGCGFRQYETTKVWLDTGDSFYISQYIDDLPIEIGKCYTLTLDIMTANPDSTWSGFCRSRLEKLELNN